MPKLEETITLHFPALHDSAGALADADPLPVCNIYDGATVIYSPTVEKLADTTGEYYADIACTAANGFEAGKKYTVKLRATVDGVSDVGVVGYLNVTAQDIDDIPTAGSGEFNLSAIVKNAAGETIPNVPLSLVGVALDTQLSETDGTIAGWNVSNGDYVLRIGSMAGFVAHADVDVTIADADQQVEITLTAAAYTPSAAGYCTMYGVTTEANSKTLRPGGTVYYEIVSDDSVPAGFADKQQGEVTSDDTTAEFSFELPQGKQYRVSTDRVRWVTFTVPEDLTESPIPGIFGNP
jgi:hypothetical protein